MVIWIKSFISSISRNINNMLIIECSLNVNRLIRSSDFKRSCILRLEIVLSNPYNSNQLFI